MYYSFDPTTLTYLLIGFFAVAALGVALAVVAVADVVMSHRRSRVAGRQSVRAYHRGLVPSH